MPKINCPFHFENTDSCEIFEDGYYCFGCGAHGPLSKLPKYIEIPKAEKKYTKSDIELSWEINAILKLPKKQIRGLDLHYDADYYYVMWPDFSYYKKRAFKETAAKYLCPKGAKKPLFECTGSWRDLMIVEGEINAMSADLVRPDFKIVSPGGVSEFTKQNYIDFYIQYEHIYIVFDRDLPGVDNAIKLCNILRKEYKRFVYLRPMQRDLNSILTTDGIDAVRRKVSAFSGVQKEMHTP